jgi:ATP-binding cassette subfamily G (WHITE) protein 2 (PDR)
MSSSNSLEQGGVNIESGCEAPGRLKGSQDSIDEKSTIDESSRADSSFLQHRHGLDVLPTEAETDIRSLARVLSNFSSHSRSGATISNPFEVADDPTLNPNSPKFDVERWVKAYLSIISQDENRYPQRTAGVSFKNLHVYGFDKATDYQKNVFNVFLTGAQKVQSYFQAERKFTILKEFDGLVRSGEMCIVLGRPGR